jgi:co-chaperonin GroES (HSP10)
MRPIGKYILIHAISEEIETGSGLVLSAEDVNAIRYKKGMVIESGTEVTTISRGDTIYYDAMAGHSMMVKDVKMTVIRELDVVVVE